MATNIPPHNLSEVIDAVQLMIERYGAVVDAGLPFPLVWTRVMRGTADPAAVQTALANLPRALGGEVRQLASQQYRARRGAGRRGAADPPRPPNRRHARRADEAHQGAGLPDSAAIVGDDGSSRPTRPATAGS